MYKCVVVIPVYKVCPKRSEQASFKRALSILKSYDVTVFTYQGLDLSVYEKISHDVEKPFSIEYFDKCFFESVFGYNKLCYNKDFYNRFIAYDYMLIYQLDAWVFRDELQYWCDKGYDYIGAPIFHAYNNKYYTTRFFGIGNGGFCLRKISHCLNVLNINGNRPFLKPLLIISLYWNYFKYSDKFKKSVNRLRIIPIVIAKIFGKYNTLNYYIKNHVNEDLLFGTWSAQAWGIKANIPSMKEAMGFSFEVHPEMLYHKNGDKLPFGCHAFEKWDYETFWSNYINF